MKKDIAQTQAKPVVTIPNTSLDYEPEREGLPDSFFTNENIDEVIQTYKLIFLDHPTPIWIYDLSTLKFLVVNNAAVEKYGYTIEEFKSMSIKDIRPQSEVMRLVEDLERGRPTRVQNSGVWLHRRKDGSLINVQINSQAIDIHGGRAVMVTAQDITEQYRNTIKLRQLNRLYTILSDINQSIVRQHNLPDLFKHVCDLVIDKGAFALAWISLAVDNSRKSERVEAVSSTSPELLRLSRLVIGERGPDLGTLFNSTFSGTPVFLNSVEKTALTDIFPEGFIEEETSAFAYLPLVVDGEIRGAINLFSLQPEIFDDQEQDLLMEMSCDIAFAIEYDDQDRKRREAEMDLQFKTAELDRYFESNLDMLCIADNKGCFRRLNPEWEKTIGYPLSELEGKSFLDLVHPDDIMSTQETMKSLEGQNKVLNFTNRYRCKDGSFKYLEWRAFPYGDLIYASARDVTSYLLAEENLRRSQRQFAAFIKLFPGPAFMKDHERRFLYVSSDFANSYNIPAENWIGHTMEEMVSAPYTSQIRLEEDRIIASGRPYTVEINTNPSKPTRGRWLLTTIFPMVHGSGATDLGGFSLDVTNLKKREKEIQTLYELSTALRPLQSLDEIIAIICKTLRQALDADSGQIILPDAERKNFIISGVDGHISTSLGHRFPIGEGISSWVWKTGQTYVSDDYASDTHHSHALDEKNLTGPSIFTPIRSEEDLIGVLFVSRLRSPEVFKFGPEEVRLFMAIGEIAGSALRRAGLYTDALRRLNHVQALRNIDLAIAGTTDLQQTFDLVLTEVKNELEIDAAAILLLDENDQLLKFAAGQGFRTNFIEKSTLSIGQGLAGQAAKKKEVCFSHHLSQYSDFIRKDIQQAEGFEVCFSAPMISKNKVLGVLEIFHRTPRPAPDEWRNLLVAMAGRAAIAVDNARLITDLQHSNEVLRQAYDATILGWSRAMDLRDEDTEGHTQRVTELTLHLARAMKFSEEELIHVRRGALLHDMGKLGVPDHILRKPGPLTEEEWAVMRCHPLYTYEMLSPIDFLKPALDIPFYHHEKWDGTGYPNGLSGDAIPLAARIFAVIDVYDALTSDRPYRSAWPVEKALEHIRQGSGSHFDPQVVDLFLKMMEDFDSDPFSSLEI